MTTRPEIVGYLNERDLDVMPRDLAEHLQGEPSFPFKTPLIRLADYEALVAPAVQGEPVAFDEDAALSLAKRTFRSEVDDQLAEDVIQYARRLHGLYAAPQPAEQQSTPDVAGLVEALELAHSALASPVAMDQIQPASVRLPFNSKASLEGERS